MSALFNRACVKEMVGTRSRALLLYTVTPASRFESSVLRRIFIGENDFWNVLSVTPTRGALKVAVHALGERLLHLDDLLEGRYDCLTVDHMLRGPVEEDVQVLANQRALTRQ